MSRKRPEGEALARRVARLDEPAFRALYDRELPYVMGTMRRLGVPKDEAEDLAHDVFVVVFKRWQDYDASRPLRPWLFGIAYRTASRTLARSWRTRELPIEGDVVSTASSTATRDSTAQDARDLLLRALAALEIDHRAVCVLHDLDGFGAPEIATALEIPVDTVYSRLRVARERLARAVRRLQGGDR